MSSPRVAQATFDVVQCIMHLNKWRPIGYGLVLATLLCGCPNREPSANVGRTADAAQPRYSASALRAAPEAMLTADSGATAAPKQRLEQARLDCLRDLYGIEVVSHGVKTHEGPIPYDDGATKTDAARIENADIEDTFAVVYPRLAPLPTQAPTEDPGRARSEPLLKWLYGHDARAVESHLTRVDVFGTKLAVHQRVAGPLSRVLEHLAPVRERSDIRTVFSAMGGTYNPRTIAGTDRLSAHAFGIAIDLNTAVSRYWRSAATYKNEIPREVVEAFESEGFIWGGRWHHFDTMHFEYRPELTQCNPQQ